MKLLGTVAISFTAAGAGLGGGEPNPKSPGSLPTPPRAGTLQSHRGSGFFCFCFFCNFYLDRKNKRRKKKRKKIIKLSKVTAINSK